MAEGTLITESLRIGASLEGVPLSVNSIHRVEAKLSPEQVENGLSSIWTVLEFTLDDDRAPALAVALSRALSPFGWYANLQSPAESFVVFTGRVFRYPRGDAAGRLGAQEHGRAHGVPEAQLDWTV